MNGQETAVQVQGGNRHLDHTDPKLELEKRLAQMIDSYATTIEKPVHLAIGDAIDMLVRRKMILDQTPHEPPLHRRETQSS